MMLRLLTLILIVLLGALLWYALKDVIPPFEGLYSYAVDAREKVAEAPQLWALVFILLYALVTGLALPFAVPLSLIAGGVFGLGLGTVLVSFGSTGGAVLAFLAARHLVRDKVVSRFGPKLTAIEDGLTKDGVFYLLTLRLIPVVPYTVTNLLMGLTRLPLWKYWLASQAGMLPATLVYVNAGTQLGKLDNLSEILRPGFVIALVLLGLLPFLARAALAFWTRRKLYARWTRPATFDRNLIVIGAGSAGLVGTYIARALKAEVTLVEEAKMGGDCLNTGCVPSKALIHFGKLAHEAQKARTLGFQVTGQANLKTVMAGLREAIATIEPHDSIERYQGLGAEVLSGHAVLIDPWTVEITAPDGTTARRTARAILLASGARPALPDVPGLAEAAHVTSDTLWDHLDTLDALPQRIAVIGGGPIGCELAQAFARLGARVTLIHRGVRLLKADEPDAAAIVETALRRDGVDIRLNDTFSAVEGKTLRLASGDMQADLIVVATGREARLTGYGLETLGIRTDRLIAVNDCLQTSLPNIYAAGDCASAQQFTHLAAHQATTATINALLNGLWSLKLKTDVVPRVTFTDPEVAAVGLTCEQAPDAEVTDFPLAQLDRAVAEGVREGFVRVLTEKGRDRILGATIVGPRAGEMIGEFALAMQSGLGLKAILRTVHAYPTWSDAVKLTAGAYTRERVSPRTSRLLTRFNTWRRG
jgi:pyruvate/2-oxoglutarate dehydrogenase complex dihydrolipoamide dehydrogenase (E3) component/uncharacterized membrane protein YdjX (TVP38/TMEM64 family)